MKHAGTVSACIATILLSLVATLGIATESVSPGSLDRMAQVNNACPTFSWGADEGAAAYEVVAYVLPEDASQQVELTAEIEVLYTRVTGSATSWTPSAERCFAPGGRYVWFVREATKLAAGEVVEAGEWSAGRYFTVPAGPTAEELARALDVLKRWEAANGDGSPPLFTAAAPAAAAVAAPAAASGAGAGGGAGTSHPKSVPTASAAIRGANPEYDVEAYGIVGVTNSVYGAGVAAANTEGGADLVLDGSLDGMADTLLAEWGINRPAPTDQIFTLQNTDAGRLHLNVVGDLFGHTIDVEELKINGSTVIDDTGEWLGSGDMLPCPGCVGSTDLADGAVTAAKLAAGAVGSTALGPGTVQSSHLADESVTSAKIEAGGVTTANLDSSAVTGAKIADGTVGTVDLADEAVTSVKIESRGILTANIDFGAVTSAEIFDGTIAADDLADDAVTGAKLADGAVGSNVISSNAVTNAHLADDAVTTAEILDGTVAGADIADGAIDYRKLATGAVRSQQILDGTVAGADIADGAIDYRKLATGAVRSQQILDGAVGGQDLADGAVTTSKIGDFSITATKIGPSVISGTHIADNAVNVSEIMAGAVISSKIAADAVTSEKVLDGSLVGTDIDPLGGVYSSRDAIYTVEASSTAPAGDLGSVEAACNDLNDLPLQGGCRGFPLFLTMKNAEPVDWELTDPPAVAKFHCVMANTGGMSLSISASIVCIDVPGSGE